jgi:5'-3' exonuclease
VSEDRVVQIDRRSKKILNAKAIREKFGVNPNLIPDFLALVGDSADGYPGIPGIGKISAARMLNKYGPIEAFPKHALGEHRKNALLFKRLATLRTDAPLFKKVSQLQWHGPTSTFEKFTKKFNEPRLLNRANALAAKLV